VQYLIFLTLFFLAAPLLVIVLAGAFIIWAFYQFFKGNASWMVALFMLIVLIALIS